MKQIKNIVFDFGGVVIGLDREQVVAFGDGLNDVDMLKSAGTGIAMGGCPRAVSDAADYTTAPIHQDGIFDALRHFGWIG